jgi:hypothetical protein
MPVVVNGVKQLQKAMRDVEPQLNKEMLKNIKVAMLIVRNKARGYLPQQNEVLSGWAKGTASTETIKSKYDAFPPYNYTQARDGIIYSAGKNKRNMSGFSAAFYVANTTAPGMIFEWAGRKNRPEGAGSLNPNASAQFNSAAEMLTSMKGQGQFKGRAVYRAWDETKNKVIPAVVNAIESTAIKFNKNTEIKRVA